MCWFAISWITNGVMIVKKCQFVNVSTYNLKNAVFRFENKILLVRLVSCCISSFDLDIIYSCCCEIDFEWSLWGNQESLFVSVVLFACLIKQLIWFGGLYSLSFYSTLCPKIDENFLLFQICFTWNHIPWFSGGYVLKSIDFV